MRLGHSVIHQRAGQELPILIVDHFLKQRLRQALGNATVHLSIHDERIDDVAAIVHR